MYMFVEILSSAKERYVIANHFHYGNKKKRFVDNKTYSGTLV